MVTEHTNLHIGIASLPGKPQAIGVRVIEPSGARKPYQPGFLLPSITTIAPAASIIAPPGVFRAGAILELSGAPYKRVRATQLVERGIDFDRISFDVASSPSAAG
jgi:hypothetical protein